MTYNKIWLLCGLIVQRQGASQVKRTVPRAESRGVVGFDVEFVGVYWPPLIAATRALSLSGKSSAIDVSER